MVIIDGKEEFYLDFPAGLKIFFPLVDWDGFKKF